MRCPFKLHWLSQQKFGGTRQGGTGDVCQGCETSHSFDLRVIHCSKTDNLTFAQNAAKVGNEPIAEASNLRCARTQRKNFRTCKISSVATQRDNQPFMQVAARTKHSRIKSRDGAGLLQVQLVLTQHSFADATEQFWRGSRFHQTSRSECRNKSIPNYLFAAIAPVLQSLFRPVRQQCS